MALAVDILREKNIVKGYAENMFKPEKSINRAEFLKIVLLAKYYQEEIDAVNTQYFSDIKPKDWYKKYANFAKKNNIISGYSNGTFGGANTINFAEASKIIVNTLIEPTEISTEENWSAPFVEKLSNKNLETYSPKKELTRGDMAKLIYKLVK